MHITIITTGSRGDVQPPIALGRALLLDGHAVRLATHARFKEAVSNHGLEFAPVADAQTAVDRVGGHQALAEKHFSFRLLNKLTHSLAPYLSRGMEDCLHACDDTDALIVTGLGVVLGYHIAEKLKLPIIRAFPSPVTPSRTYPTFVVPASLRMGGRFNLWSHHLRGEFWWLLLRASLNQARDEILELPPLSFRDPFKGLDDARSLLLYGYSPRLFPRPADWGEWIHVTGPWFLDRSETWCPPPDLLDFLESGPPPVSVGFGSMGNRNPEEAAEIVVAALARAGQRGVLLTGWGGLANRALSDDVFVVDEIPHDWLFPRMAAVVHHGGAGTTHAAVRAGVPSIVVPFLADQGFWGQRLYEIGAGTRPLPRHQLSAEVLAERVHTATGDEAMQRRARTLGAQLNAEDGLGRAIGLIGSYLHGGGGKGSAERTSPRECSPAAHGHNDFVSLSSSRGGEEARWK